MMASSITAAHTHTAHTILVVDDSIEVLQLICSALTQAGYVALAAKSARQALERLELIVPDGILLDAVMPEMHGFVLCKHIKEQPAWQHIPIVFMTGLADSDHIVQGFACGAVDYVVKPLSMPEVLARLTTHIRNARTTRLAQEAADVVGMGVAVLDSHGRIAWLSPKAKQWLTIAIPHPLQQQAWLLQAAQKSGHSCLLDARQVLHAHPVMRDNFGETMLLLSTHAPAQSTGKRHVSLTPREKDVLNWLSKGKTNRDIGEILGMSPRTVNKHLEHIFEKLGVENRTAAATLAEQLV